MSIDPPQQAEARILPLFEISETYGSPQRCIHVCSTFKKELHKLQVGLLTCKPERDSIPYVGISTMVEEESRELEVTPFTREMQCPRVSILHIGTLLDEKFHEV
ncbi:hypothetical protein BFW01_g8935 [Lasiodiplodia theobromae]|nr:hypothetical protein BFW01_g8935 [Lasiodiplodia theobromae]